jgi:hypothetical protein
MKKNPNQLQLIWGAALTAAGVGVFVYLPQRMEQIRELRQSDPFSFDMLFLWFCFGLMGVILVGGGLRKLYGFFKKPIDNDPVDQGRD